MTFIKLDKEHQELADLSYNMEKEILDLVNSKHTTMPWRGIAYDQISLGFMAFRRAITEHQKTFGRNGDVVGKWPMTCDCGKYVNPDKAVDVSKDPFNVRPW
jgi:hypothetical protein